MAENETPPQFRSYADLLAGEEKRQRAQLMENLASCPTTWDAITYGLGRDIFPLALIASAHWMDLDELAKAVEASWTMPDNPQTQLTREDWLGYFQKVGYLDNTVRAPRPSEPITVWRGADASRRRRWSWTTDTDRAEWFADRLTSAGIDGRVWKTTAPARARLAHFHGEDSRGEDEHVINTKGLKIMEVDHG